MHKNYLDARRKYDKALRYYNWMMNRKMSDTLDASLKKEVQVAILSNLAAVKLKEGKHREALNLCNEVIQFEIQNIFKSLKLKKHIVNFV